MSSPPAPFDPIAVDLRDYVDFNLASASGRRVFATDVVAVDLLSLEPRQVVEARTFATADVIYTVLGGRAWVVTDDTEVTLEALQSVMVPGGVPHGVRNDSPDPLILQLVISPPDEAPEAAVGPADAADAERRSARAEPPNPPPRRSTLVDRLRRTLGG
ncbi:MAG: cupin domain-containing protein [Nitriliruptorales bacterium]|nr:cupin domain-containing protein [Nitriliruptorales bacterium]